MILLNYAHPLTEEHLAQIEALIGVAVARLVEVPSQVDVQEPLTEQVTALVDAAGLGPAEWQSGTILVNPPALNFSALLLLAEMHGRMGYFPACLRLRPVAGAVPPRWEVAEVLNIQAVREAARARRGLPR